LFIEKKGKDFYPDAEKYLGRALEINPIDTEAHGMLGGLLKRKGDLQNAKRHYVLAYKIAPKSLYAIIAVAGLSVLLSNENDARKYYMEVIQVANQEIESGKDNYWTYLSLGEAYVAMGNVIESKVSFQRALEYEPPIEDVRSSYDQLVALSKEGFCINEIQEITNGDLARYLGLSQPKA
jgi:tetratricopeptide (TPR) repeat protein